MQRKNNLLKSRRNAMAMIMAIGVIVIIATIMALALSLSTQTTKKTADLYVHEQAVLLSKSAAEYALLQISLNDNTVDPCAITNIPFSPPAPLDYYDINISIKYVYTSLCSTASNSFTTVTTPEQNGSVLMDITVSVDDATITSEPITYFRRSIQKL